MRPWTFAAGLAAAAALPLALAPSMALASCSDTKTTGAVLGGVGGALIGNSIARGPAGLILGGIGGAVVGHEIAGSTCRHAHYAYARPPYPSRAYPPAPPPPVAPAVYYDQYGNPVRPVAGPAPASAPPPQIAPVTYAAAANCHTETRSFYDDRGALVHQPVQVCDR